jgi:hypothetical protein
MKETRDLRAIYDERLGKGPFPTDECEAARIGGALHGNLILYLANIAGLACRGTGLATLPQTEKQAFLRTVDGSLFDKHPDLRRKITLKHTPKLYALVQATEEARVIILDALRH